MVNRVGSCYHWSLYTVLESWPLPSTPQYAWCGVLLSLIIVHCARKLTLPSTPQYAWGGVLLSLIIVHCARELTPAVHSSVCLMWGLVITDHCTLCSRADPCRPLLSMPDVGSCYHWSLYTVLESWPLPSTPQACMMWDLVIKHCENPIYVFQETKLRGLVPNSYIHVPVSDLNIPRISLPIWLQQNRQTNPGNI